ncbi:MAG: glycosyltransferase family 4 protein [Acidobacteria bacterium]|nr:glycosyltransferase family 4 protein [Acidobacteriota bacterium]
MSSLNLLMWPNFFFPKTGGVATVVYNLAHQLRYYDIHTSVVTETFRDAPAMERGSWGGAVFRIPFMVPEAELGDAANRYMSPLRRIIVDESIDLVHVHLLDIQGYYANVLLKEVKIPLVVSIHGSDIFHFHRKNRFLQEQAISLLEKAQLVISCSAALAQELEAIMADARASNPNIAVIPNGINISCLSYAVESAARPRPGGPIRVLGIGRLDWVKGFDILVQAVYLIKEERTIPKLAVQIVGDGEEREPLQRMVQELGLVDCIGFNGECPNDLIPRFLQTADMLVVPSRTEGFGIVVLEGMCAGLPIVASATGGIPEIITHGRHGWLVPPENPRALAEALLSAIRDRARWPDYAMQNRNDVRRYDWRHISARYAKTYRDLLV